MPTHDVLTLRQLNRATLARQMLLAREAVRPLDAIERLVAMQAQWPKPPYFGLWTRIEGFERSHLTSLLTARKAVRATFLRGTLHVVSSKDFVAFRPAIRPVLEAAMRMILDTRLDGIDLGRLVSTARRLLDGQPQTFETLRDRLLETGLSKDERAMGYAVRMLLPLVQVPEADEPWGFPARASFAPAETWLGRQLPDKTDRADALVMRYLAGYGPASAADIQAWAGLGKQTVAETLDRLRPRLRTFHDERKRELFDLPDAPRPDADTPAPVRLVPEYDNLITTRADERFVARSDRPRVFLSALRVAATVLVDGFVAGVWKLQAAKKGVTVTIEPFEAMASRVRKDVAAEAEAAARFAEPDARAVDVKFA